MNSTFSRTGSAVALCAAALLALSACSDDSTGSANPTSSAAESSTAEAIAAELDARAEDLMLPESAFPGGGEYVVLDKAAIDADDADDSDDPQVTPATCSAIADRDEGTEDFDRARVEYEFDNGLSIETEVVLGQSGDFDSAVADIEACPAMTMRGQMEDGSDLVAELENSLEDVDGATVPAMTMISTGTVTVGDQTAPMMIRSTGAYVDGVTVSVQVTLTGESVQTWNSDDDAIVLDLLNQQIAIVQDAAAA